MEVESRFFGLAFLIPGVVGSHLPAGFAAFAAYGDFATGVLAMLALLAARLRPLLWSLVVAFNAVGTVDILVDYYHGNQLGLGALAGELGATYAIPIIYVPLLMITHVIAFYLLLRLSSKAAGALVADLRLTRRPSYSREPNGRSLLQFLLTEKFEAMRHYVHAASSFQWRRTPAPGRAPVRQ